MRIIAGRFRGHGLFTPKDLAIRPTPDKARQALFNIIGPDIAGAAFLDLFAGTGAVGLEAVSRGAARVAAVDSSPDLAAKNAAKLKTGPAEGYTLAKGDVFHVMAAMTARGEKFDYVFADPPWDAGMERAIVARAAGLLAPGGMFILELSKRTETPDGAPHGLALQDRRGYGEATFCFYAEEQVI